MWYLCEIKVKSDMQTGISADGRDWQRVDLVLEYTDLDEQGQPAMRPDNGKPITNLVKLEAFGIRADMVEDLGVSVGSKVWANIRVQTKSVRTQSGGTFVRNDIYLVEMRKAEKQ